jgi:hypothetical protein
VARPIRFRQSQERWTPERVRRDILNPLDSNLGARAVASQFEIPGDWETRRFEMENGDLALFAWRDEAAYWAGNTETPPELWRTDKVGWDEVPYPVSRWAQRELLADLFEAAPWLEPYDHLAWFFLPVLMSKDGRHTSRRFLRDHAAGFPDADYETALDFYEEYFRTGILDEYREVMAGKLGTSETLDLGRMRSAMSEFTVAKILTAAGYELEPEIEVTTGHSLDFRASDGTSALVEVTRPSPPSNRAAGTPVAAIRETAATKTEGQLSKHGGGAVLFVDCSSFRDDQWAAIRGEQPEVRHRPAVVFRARPRGHVEGYRKGRVPLDLAAAIEWVDT